MSENSAPRLTALIARWQPATRMQVTLPRGVEKCFFLDIPSHRMSDIGIANPALLTAELSVPHSHNLDEYLLPWRGGEVDMLQYVIEREIPGAGNLSDAELQEIARKSVGVLTDMGPKIKWLHSYVTGDKVYCVYLAPDEETIREHGRRGGFPVNRVSAVRQMIDPTWAG